MLLEYLITIVLLLHIFMYLGFLIQYKSNILIYIYKYLYIIYIDIHMLRNIYIYIYEL